MKNESDIFNKFIEPFPDEDLEWRIQRGYKANNKTMIVVVPYVTNRAIQARLDNSVGPFNWKNEFKEWRGKGVLCGISICFKDQWITKYDGGALCF